MLRGIEGAWGSREGVRVRIWSSCTADGVSLCREDTRIDGYLKFEPCSLLSLMHVSIDLISGLLEMISCFIHQFPDRLESVVI